MAEPTDDQLKEASFLSGVDNNGAVSAESYKNWRLSNPTTYWPDRSFTFKWSNDENGVTSATTSKAGTPGGVITFAFDQFVDSFEQEAYLTGMALWSGIADVTFKQVPLTDSTDLLIQDDWSRSAVTTTPGAPRTVPGSTDIPSAQSPGFGQNSYQANLNIPNNGAYGFLGDYSTRGVRAVTHELGHVLGLGHGGPYDTGFPAPANNQYTAYDSQQWTVMSYNVADDTRPRFSAFDTVSGSNWDNAESPMMIDILAAQRLYGASKSLTFAGGQTYGFNCNIVGAARLPYDFTYNTVPTVTIYNAGTGNTLDCSGYSSNATINLNPGTFSSVAGRFNNVGIAFGTRIDTAVGGAGDDVIYANANSNTIDGGGGTNKAIFAGPRSNYTINQLTASSAIVTNNSNGSIDTLTNIQSLEFEDPVCFTTGTRIAIHRAGTTIEVPVESLSVGDVAVTATGAHRRIRWISQRALVPSEHAVPSKLWPVRVRAGAFGRDSRGLPMPTRDLRLSPGHPVLAGADADNEGGVLVPIMCLINGTSIARVPVAEVVYWHIELDGHDLLLAEGLPAESFFDCGTRVWFSAAACENTLIDPDLVTSDMPGRCRPVAVDGPYVAAERRRIDTLFALDFAAQSGWPKSDDVPANWLSAAH